MSRVTYTGTPGVMGSAVAAYEREHYGSGGHFEVREDHARTYRKGHGRP